jgi:AcrR family transcriptional regulator
MKKEIKKKRKPGRPRQPEKREAIIAAVRPCFGEFGYNGVSLDKLARAAGVHKASLVHFFGSKEGLYVAATDALVAEVLESLVSVFRSKTKHKKRLEEIAHAVTAYFMREPDSARVLLREGIGDGPYGMDTRRFLGQEITSAAQSYIEDGIKEGAFVDQDARAAFLAISGYVLILYGAPMISRDIINIRISKPADQEREAARFAGFMVRLLCVD